MRLAAVAVTFKEHIMQERFTRIKNDVNGNPRHIIHFLDVEPPELADDYRQRWTILQRYDLAVNAAKRYGGKAYRGRAYGGGIVFSAYDFELAGIIERIRNDRRKA
jgi:hypothetical protein